MQASFIDLVGAAPAPAHRVSRDELMNLTPAFGSTTPVDGMGAQASEVPVTINYSLC